MPSEAANCRIGALGWRVSHCLERTPIIRICVCVLSRPDAMSPGDAAGMYR